MKKIMTLLFIGFLTFTINAQEKEISKPAGDPNAAVIEFESEIIDYGKIDLNANGVRVFKFKNTGKSPLVIGKIKSSCGCTVPKQPAEPIMPGKTGEIEVKYDTKRAGGFSKMITVPSNAIGPPKRLRIKGIVTKPESQIVKKKATISS